ncbi:DUF1150 family protein [Pacificoceanicola onchidii]|uniref:DUF1150 family protein n=1 Tax=Pacificoceanicola onchidii TaxID=2562685 RepID=UPI0010A3A22A|nr:DUF1150 family protein [Pacificoceanicola onchidii]
MFTKQDLSQFNSDRVVYVRPVKTDELPHDVQVELAGLDEVYAVHNAEGERLAVVKDRDLAFVIARQNDLAPVAVH